MEYELMAVGSNGVRQHDQNKATKQPMAYKRAPRRVVLLLADEMSEIGEVLLEMRDEEVSGQRLHSEIQKQAADHAGHWVAAEWQGNLGWTRFLWCKK